MTLRVWQTRAESKGYVKIVSRDIFDHPEIYPNYLSERHDQQVLLRSIRLARQLLSTATLQPWLEGRTDPANELQNDDELLDWARTSGFPVVSAGRGHKWLPEYRTSTPEPVWGHWGLTAEQAEQGGMNPKMFNAFLDGSKPAIESAAIANATALMAQRMD